jgi:hypothetical protein
MALLGEISDRDTTRAVGGCHAPDLRAKITSASVTVLAPNSPRSYNKSHTSDTTSPSKVDIGYSSSASSATESSSEVMLQAKPVPRSKTVPDIFCRPILPPAFLPSNTNERSIASIKPNTEPQVPAYARPSMSSWYRSAANSAIQGNTSWSSACWHCAAALEWRLWQSCFTLYFYASQPLQPERFGTCVESEHNR